MEKKSDCCKCERGLVGGAACKAERAAWGADPSAGSRREMCLTRKWNIPKRSFFSREDVFYSLTNGNFVTGE